MIQEISRSRRLCVPTLLHLPSVGWTYIMVKSWTLGDSIATSWKAPEFLNHHMEKSCLQTAEWVKNKLLFLNNYKCTCYHSLAYLINTRSNMVSLSLPLSVCLTLSLLLKSGCHCSAICSPDVNWNFLFPWFLDETRINSQCLVLRVSKTFSMKSLNSHWTLWILFPFDFLSSNHLYSVPQWPDMKLRPFSESHTHTHHIHPSYQSFMSMKVHTEELERKKWRKSSQLWLWKS